MARIFESLRWVVRVIASAVYRFYWDDCFSRASSLSYTTLFALVPIVALSFSMFGVFGISDTQVNTTIDRILEQVLPPTSAPELAAITPEAQAGADQLTQLRSQLKDYLLKFNNVFRNLNILSVAVLVFTGIALLNTIESALNVVWRVTSERSLLSKMLSFWAVITLGPFLIVFTFYWHAKVAAVTGNYQVFQSKTLSLFDFLLPVTFTTFAVFLLFYALPSTRVRVKDAFFGALIAALLFEVLKRAFAYYVTLSTTYSTIYGVLTTIPIFMFWLYLVWVVILYSAEVSYLAGNIRALGGREKYATDLGEIGGILGLRILYCIARNFLEGKAPPTESELAIETGFDPVLLRAALNICSEAGILTPPDVEQHTRVLKISPDKLTVGRVFDVFRAKKYRQALEKEGQDDGLLEANLLEVVKRLSRSDLGGKKPIAEWSVEDLLTT